jgi:predicted nucleic acid-binding protein
MKRLFFDANVVVDFMDASAKYHLLTVELVRVLRKQGIQLFICPSTFVIVNHLVFKYLKNREIANQKMNLLSKLFQYSTEDQLVMDEVSKSGFSDLEDAVQYYSAKTIKPDFIITHNNKDFPFHDKTVLNFHYLAGKMKFEI